jgi:HupE / UreJ protein
MNNLSFYFNEGWHHIISLDALDHQLFLISLCALFLLNNWKKVLVLVTAFTIGHSITLALSVFNIIKISSSLVEFLIPCTIIITSILNLFTQKLSSKTLTIKYFLALFFGLIHGLGFANTIRFMLAKDQTIGWSLFGFNIGLEVGQIVVVLAILIASYLVVNICKLKQQWWVMLLSIVSLLWGLKFALERL